MHKRCFKPIIVRPCFLFDYTWLVLVFLSIYSKMRLGYYVRWTGLVKTTDVVFPFLLLPNPGKEIYLTMFLFKLHSFDYQSNASCIALGLILQWLGFIIDSWLCLFNLFLTHTEILCVELDDVKNSISK